MESADAKMPSASSSLMYCNSFAIITGVCTSNSDPLACNRKFPNSRSERCPLPSAMLLGTETAARSGGQRLTTIDQRLFSRVGNP